MFVNINKSMNGPYENGKGIKSAVTLPPPPNEEKGWVLTSRYTKEQLKLMDVPPMPKGAKFFRTYEREYNSAKLTHHEVFEICSEDSGETGRSGKLYNYWQRPISYSETPKEMCLGQEK